MVTCPAYYNVSAPKAELLNKIKDLPEVGEEEEDLLDINEKKVNSKHTSPLPSYIHEIITNPRVKCISI